MTGRLLFYCLIFFLSGFIVNAQPVYLNQTFDDINSTLAGGWMTNFFYGRDGLFRVPDAGSACGGGSAQVDTYIQVTGGVFQFRGVANRNNLAYQSIWVGHQLKYTNHTYSASPEHPFGFTVIRKYAWLDAVSDCRETEGNTSWRQKAEGSICFFVNKTIAAQSEPYNELVNFCEYVQGRFPDDGAYANTVSKYGYFDGVQRYFDLADTEGPFGKSNNLLANGLPGGRSLLWNYDDIRGGTANTNHLGFRITHDGSIIRFYLNPNPAGNANCTFPNEWCCLGEKAVTWNSNMTFMLGHGVNRFDQERSDLDFDDFIIRAVTSGAWYRMEYRSGVCRIEIGAEINECDAGIADILISLPGSTMIADKISTDFNKNGNMQTMKIINSTEPGRKNEAAVFVQPGLLAIRFCRKSDTENAVIDFKTTVKCAVIELNNDQNKMDSGLFSVFVDHEKYNTGYYSKYATTGRQKAVFKPEKPVSGVIVIK